MRSIITLLVVLCWFSTYAQNSEPTPTTAPAPIIQYGTSVSLAMAKKIAATAEAYASTKQYTIVVAIVDTGGNLVYLEKMDNTQIASIEVAIGKAKTSNNFKRPTKALEDALAKGGIGMRILAMPVYPVEGGELILQDGKIIGAIGISGMTSGQDDEVAKAGLAAVK